MPDEEIKELMGEYNLDEEGAERLKEVMDETGLDADEAAELLDDL